LIGKGGVYMTSAVDGKIQINAQLNATQAFKGLSELSKGVLKFEEDCADQATELEKVQDQIDFVFGAEGAKKIENFAATASEQFGLSELSTKNFIGTMGLMLESMGLTDNQALDMSTDLTGLAADMASLSGQDPQEVFDKLSDAVSGNSDALSDFKIDLSDAKLKAFALSEGMSKSYESMSEAEKATLRYKYIMAETKDVQGEFAKNSGDLLNKQETLTSNFDDLKTSVGECLLKAFEPLLGILNKVVKFLSEHPTLLGALVIGIGAMAVAIMILATAMLFIAVAGAPLFGMMLLVSLIIGAIAVGVYLLIKNWSTVSGFFSKLWNTVKSIFVNAWNGIVSFFTDLWNDIVLLAQTIWGGLVSLFTTLWDGIVLVVTTIWDGIKTFFTDLWNEIVLIAQTIWGGLVSFFTTLWDGLVDTFTTVWNGIVTFFTDLWNGIVLVATTIWTGLSTFFSSLWTTIFTAITIVWGIIRDFFIDLWTGICIAASGSWEWIKEIWAVVATWFMDNVITPITDFFSNLWGNISSAASTAWQGIKNAFSTVGDFFQGVWDTIKEKFTSIGTTVGNAMGEAFATVVNTIIDFAEDTINGFIKAINIAIKVINAIPGVHISYLKTLSIPRLAQGAVIPPNRQFLAVLGDQTSGVNIETPLATMIKAFEASLDSRANGISQNISVTVQADDLQQMADVVSLFSSFRQTVRQGA